MWTAFIILLLLIVGLLYAPVSLHVHSHTREVYANVWNIFYARLLIIQSEPALQLSFFAWKKILYLFRHRAKKTSSSDKGAVSAKKSWKRPSFLTVKRMRYLLSSFKIRELDLDIDTRDVVWNAYLYPLSIWLLNKGYPIRINYLNRFHMDLVIENRLGSVLKALILSYVKPLNTNYYGNEI